MIYFWLRWFRIQNSWTQDLFLQASFDDNSQFMVAMLRWVFICGWYSRLFFTIWLISNISIPLFLFYLHFQWWFLCVVQLFPHKHILRWNFFLLGSVVWPTKLLYLYWMSLISLRRYHFSPSIHCFLINEAWIFGFLLFSYFLYFL